MSEKKFEDKLEELEAIVNQLENGNIELDVSIRLFEKGIKLSRECSRDIQKAEKKVRILLKDEMTGEFSLEDWDDNE